MADLAIWMAGHVSVPIYPSLRVQSIRRILEHCDAKACFVGATDGVDVGPACCPDIETVVLPTAQSNGEVGWNALIEANRPIAGEPVRNADDLATIIYTSGTTGVPKGVMHRFGSFAFNAKALTRILGLTDKQRVLSYLPLAHIVERAGVEAASLQLGSRLFFTAGLDTFVEDLQRAAPTLFISVPRLLLKFQQGVFARMPQAKLEKLLRIPAVNVYVKRKILRGLGLNTVRHAACGAAPLPTEILLWYRRLGLGLLEGYGMTETMITHLPRPDTVRPGYVGPALPGVEAKVGADGELLIRSPMNMAGYYREPEMTREAFSADGFFRTGDKVMIDVDGQLKIVGRIKEQFKTSKGKYVAPAPIEGKLMEHSGVEACCLMGAGQPSPFAIVVLSEDARARCLDPELRKVFEHSLGEHLETVNAELDSFERISMIVIADGPWSIHNDLMTPTLKIKRGALESRYEQRVEEWRRQNSPVLWETLPGYPNAPYVAGAAADSPGAT
jgi:long-chain acyl-CoA synthetase